MKEKHTRREKRKKKIRQREQASKINVREERSKINKVGGCNCNKSNKVKRWAVEVMQNSATRWRENSSSWFLFI